MMSSSNSSGLRFLHHRRHHHSYNTLHLITTIAIAIATTVDTHTISSPRCRLATKIQHIPRVVLWSCARRPEKEDFSFGCLLFYCCLPLVSKFIGSQQEKTLLTFLSPLFSLTPEVSQPPSLVAQPCSFNHTSHTSPFPFGLLQFSHILPPFKAHR